MKKNYYQNIRGICVLLVILIHIMYFTNILIFDYSNIIIRKLINFSVGLFIFMSGFFLDIKTNTLDLYKKRMKRILIPFVIWDLIYTVIFSLSKRDGLLIFLRNYLISVKGFHLYYLYVLIELTLITPLLIKYFNKYKNSSMVYLPLMITPVFNAIYSFISLNFFDKYFLIYRYMFVAWISYYYMGIILNNRHKEHFNNKNYGYTHIGLLILNIIEGVFIYNVYDNYEIATTQLTLINSIYTLSTCFLIVKHYNDVKENIITKIGNYSYGIYLSHILFLSIISKAVKLLNLNYYIYVICTFLITVTVVVFVNFIYYRFKEKVSYDRYKR